VLSPFLPAFLNSRQLRSDEIGFVLGTATAVRLIAGPVAGVVADRNQRARTVFAVCTIGAAAFALSNVALRAFWPLFVATILWSASIAPAAPLTDALALAAAKPRHSNRGFEYSWVRGAGSAGFVLGTIGAGQLVGPLGPGVTLALQACLLVFAATWIIGVPNYLAIPRGSRDPAEEGMLLELFRLRAFRHIVLIAALVLGSHALHDSFAVIYWNSAGISPAVVSILWSEQVVAEVVVFLVVGPALLGWIGPARALPHRAKHKARQRGSNPAPSGAPGVPHDQMDGCCEEQFALVSEPDPSVARRLQRAFSTQCRIRKSLAGSTRHRDWLPRHVEARTWGLG
jgi:MFS transporter, PPP family, 3-phenylpropionic acid transporter